MRLKTDQERRKAKVRPGQERNQEAGESIIAKAKFFVSLAESIYLLVKAVGRCLGLKKSPGAQIMEGCSKEQARAGPIEYFRSARADGLEKGRP